MLSPPPGSSRRRLEKRRRRRSESTFSTSFSTVTAEAERAAVPPRRIGWHGDGRGGGVAAVVGGAGGEPRRRGLACEEQGACARRRARWCEWRRAGGSARRRVRDSTSGVSIGGAIGGSGGGVSCDASGGVRISRPAVEFRRAMRRHRRPPAPTAHATASAASSAITTYAHASRRGSARAMRCAALGTALRRSNVNGIGAQALQRERTPATESYSSSSPAIARRSSPRRAGNVMMTTARDARHDNRQFSPRRSIRSLACLSDRPFLCPYLSTHAFLLSRYIIDSAPPPAPLAHTRV